MFSANRNKTLILIIVTSVLWFVAHISAIGFFAHVPFVSAVVGDEPSPIYGALSVLEAKNPLGLRNVPQLYYGPVFAAVAIPAIATDVAIQFAKGAVDDAESYRALIARDMAGMLIASRWLAVLAGFFALFGVYRLFQSKQLNPEGKTWWVWLAVLGIALDPFFFKYSHFFRHWIFIVAVLIWNLVFILRISEKPEDKKAWFGLWATSAFGFGVSFISLFYQAALFPVLLSWAKGKRIQPLKYFVAYGSALLAAMVVLVAWDPFPYMRLIRMGTSSGTGHTLHLGLPTLWSYLSFLANNYALLGVLAIGLSVLAWVVARERVRTWWWMLVWPAIIHFFFFAASETDPPRYLLPIYVLLWLIAVGCLSSLWPWLQRHRFSKFVFALFVVSIILSGVNAARWSWLASQMQPEEKLIQSLRETSASSSVLFVGRLLPAWHDPSAYKNFSEHCLDYVSDLFPYMATLPPLPGVKPLYVEYWCSDEEIPANIRGYATDIIEVGPGESLESNALEANWWRHWDMEKWGLRFQAVKGNLAL